MHSEYRGDRLYTPDPVPFDAESLPRYLETEFERLSTTFARIVDETAVPKGALRLSAPVQDVVIGNVWVPLLIFDAVIVQRGGILVAGDQITVRQSANYEVNIGVNASLAQTEQLDIMMTINGVHAYNSPLSLQGLGINDAPSGMTWVSNVPLVTGDVIAWEVRNGDPGSVSIEFLRSNFSVRRD